MKKGERTRLKILATAVELTEAKGFEKMSFQDIANKCGITQQGVMKYFKTKNLLFSGLLNFILQDVYSQVSGKIQSTDSLKKKFLKHFEAQLDYLNHSSVALQIYTLFYSNACFDSESKEAYSLLLQKVRDTYANYFDPTATSLSDLDEKFQLKIICLHEFFMGCIINYGCSPAGTKSREEVSKKLSFAIELIL